MRRSMFTMLVIILGALAVACDGGGDPAITVEQYLQAKVDGDADTVRALLCSELEGQLEREIRTFDSVSGVELQNMACTRVDNSNRVSCDGVIVALYGEEETEFPLVTYRVVQEDGEWKWCGEG